MSAHRNARTNPFSRELLVCRILKDGWTVRAAAEAVGVSRSTAHKWLARYRQEGRAGLRDLGCAMNSCNFFSIIVCFIFSSPFLHASKGTFLSRPVATRRDPADPTILDSHDQSSSTDVMRVDAERFQALLGTKGS